MSSNDVDRNQDQASCKRKRETLSMSEASHQCKQVGAFITAMDERPDLIVGLANGGIMPAVIAAETVGLPYHIMKVRRKSSRIKQRLKLLAKIARYFPSFLNSVFAKKFKRSFDAKYNQIESDSSGDPMPKVSGLKILIVDDCIDSGSTVAHVRDKMQHAGAKWVKTAVISWGTKHDSEKLHRVVPDMHLHRTIDVYPWTMQNPAYDEFIGWLHKKGFKLWV